MMEPKQKAMGKLSTWKVMKQKYKKRQYTIEKTIKNGIGLGEKTNIL